MPKLLVIGGCTQCPHMKTRLTKGFGYAEDYSCEKTGRVIAGYVEWSSQAPKPGTSPKWCPLKDTKRKVT